VNLSEYSGAHELEKSVCIETRPVHRHCILGEREYMTIKAGSILKSPEV